MARVGIGRVTSGLGSSGLPANAGRDARALGATPRERQADHDEFLQLPTVFNQAKALTTLGSKPLFVLTADLGQQAGWFALQNKLVALSANSAHETTHGATHSALLEDRAIATATGRAIGDVVRAARSGRTITR
jgi:hypothetical protein